jgi:hypothetical protein
MLSLSSKAQQKDSLVAKNDSAVVYFFTETHLDSSINRNAIWLDTAFYQVQKYDPLLRTEDFSQSLGNIGLANKNMVFSPTANSGFDLGIHSMDGYRTTNENVRYYSSIAPFTELKLIMGSHREQVFQVIHSHTIKKQLTIAANFRIINSAGKSSFRQKSDDITTYFTVYYTTKNNRYGVFGHYFYNRMKWQENGGILVDSSYEQSREGRNYTQFAYGLSAAQNTLKENAWFLKQYVDLDFRKSDSASDSRKKGFSLGRLTLTTSYTKPRYIYKDTDIGSDYYQVLYTDSTYINDSVFFKKLENTLNWTSNETNAMGKPSVFRFFAGFRHAYIEIHEQPINSYLSQYTPSAGFSLNIINRILVSASTEYVIGDYNGGDFFAKARAAFRFGVNKYKGTLSLSANFSLAKLPWMAHHYYTDIFRWDYNYIQQQTISASLLYTYPNLEARLDWYNLTNAMYWDEYARPRQFRGNAINVYSLFLKKNFVFGKFEIDNKAVLQYSDNDNIIHLPWLVASQSYFVTFNMFKKALRVQTGIDAWYNTPYYADAWMPASKQFYLQSDRKVGNYVYIDVFLSLKIKRAFIFLALDHVNSGLMGYKYYTTPHYPSVDRTFKFGVSWLFHD